MNVTLLALLFSTYTAEFKLPANSLSALCYVESTHNIHAIHHDDGGSNSVGICQIKWKTAKWLGFKGTEKQLMNPRINIYYAAKYLSYQYKRYNNINKAFIAYNIGNAKGLTSTKYSTKVITQWRVLNVQERKTANVTNRLKR